MIFQIQDKGEKKVWLGWFYGGLLELLVMVLEMSILYLVLIEKKIPYLEGIQEKESSKGCYEEGSSLSFFYTFR